MHARQSKFAATTPFTVRSIHGSQKHRKRFAHEPPGDRRVDRTIRPACSCDAFSDYGFATSFAADPTRMWYSNSSYDNTYVYYKTLAFFDRAVRDGS